MAWRNAVRWYSWDPFQHRSKESSTVTALRAEVPGRDVSERSYDQGRREHQIGANLAELAAGATA